MDQQLNLFAKKVVLPNNRQLSIGFIGYAGHALVLLKYVADALTDHGHFETDSKILLYHPSKIPTIDPNVANLVKDISATSDLQDLLSCDCIFVASPDHTHFSYISDLLDKGFKNYIFCEKPLTYSKSELEKIEAEFPRNRVFFNFNLRFSSLVQNVIYAVDSGYLGQHIYTDFLIMHGLSFKEIYRDSWREKTGAFYKTVIPHMIDLVGWTLSPIKDIVDINFRSLGSNTEKNDTCILTVRLLDDSTAALVSSYSAPYTFKMSTFGTNGKLDLSRDHVEARSPRDTFDGSGNFSEPPTMIASHLSSLEDIFEESLKRSVQFFIGCVAQQRDIPFKHFQHSISTTKIAIQAISKIQDEIE